MCVVYLVMTYFATKCNKHTSTFPGPAHQIWSIVSSFHCIYWTSCTRNIIFTIIVNGGYHHPSLTLFIAYKIAYEIQDLLQQLKQKFHYELYLFLIITINFTKSTVKA